MTPQHVHQTRTDPIQQRLCEEIAASQVVHVDLAEYAVGSKRYERLMEAMNNNLRFSWPLEGVNL